MIGFGARLFEDEAGRGDDYGVSADYEGGIGDGYGGGVLGYGYLVDVEGFLEGCLQDIFEGS